MTLKIMTDNGPVEEALFDGYAVGDRELEGVMFRIRIEDNRLICLGHRKMDDAYMDKFSKKQLKSWHDAILENIEAFGGDTLECDGQEAWVEGLNPSGNIPVEIKVTKGGLIMDLLNGKKTD